MIILMSRVVTLHNKKTSMRLTNVEWNIFAQVCKCEKIKRKTLLELICDSHCAELNLTSAVRLFMLLYLAEQKPLNDSLFANNRTYLLHLLQKLS